MTKRTCGFLLLAIVSVLAISASASAQPPKFFPVSEIRPGMKGMGRTVFQGTAIEDFQVEVLGVLKNYGPKQDMILARLSGGPLEKTGVVQGMSGSPVYIDGRLVGAVAFAFPYATQSVAGIQPIEQMTGVLDQMPATPVLKGVPASASLPQESPAAFIYGIVEKLREGRPIQELFGPALSPASMPSSTSLVQLQTPLFLSGVTAAAAQQFSSFFSGLGFNPVQGGAAGTVANVGSVSSRLEPGSTVSAELVRGDMNISANGTVTYVDGNKVYAFGHPFLSAGPISVPMSSAYVISLLPKLDTSIKLAFPVDVVGAFQQDRSTGILGTMGDKPNMIPVVLDVRSSTNATNHYNVEVANDRYLTPILMNYAVVNAITASERGVGEMTLSVTGEVHIRNNDSVKIATMFSGDGNGPSAATAAAVAPIQYLVTGGYEGLIIDKVDFQIVSTDRKTLATLDRITVDRNEVRPGETVALSALMREPNGQTFIERYSVLIPTGLPSGTVQLLVGDGTTMTGIELKRSPSGIPMDLKTVIRELNKLRRNDRLYVRVLSNQPGVVIRGEEMPSLPPSMIGLLGTDRASSRNVTSMGSSAVAEYEFPQSKYVIQGQQSLTLTVKP
jgi:hypothetical protein